MTETTTIYICVKCRMADETPEPSGERTGAKFFRAVAAVAAEVTDIVVEPVECLSVCKRPVTVGFAGAGKWTYVYGDFAPDGAAALIDCARAFARAPDGLIPWSERPDALKRGVVARLPPR